MNNVTREVGRRREGDNRINMWHRENGGGNAGSRESGKERENDYLVEVQPTRGNERSSEGLCWGLLV